MSGDGSRLPLDSRPWPELAGHLPILRALEAVGRERFGSAWRDDGPVPLRDDSMIPFEVDGSFVRHPDGSIAFPPPGDVHAYDPDKLRPPDGSVAAARASWHRLKAARKLLLQWLRGTPPDYPDALPALGWPDGGSPSPIEPGVWWTSKRKDWQDGPPPRWESAFAGSVPGLGWIYVDATALAEKLKTFGETAPDHRGRPAQGPNTPLQRGRRPIPGDEALVEEGVGLLRRGEVRTATAAAEGVIDRAVGNSPESKLDRIRRKIGAKWRKELVDPVNHQNRPFKSK